jgi:hypothetical protein
MSRQSIDQVSLPAADIAYSDPAQDRALGVEEFAVWPGAIAAVVAFIGLLVGCALVGAAIVMAGAFG